MLEIQDDFGTENVSVIVYSPYEKRVSNPPSQKTDADFTVKKICIWISPYIKLYPDKKNVFLFSFDI